MTKEFFERGKKIAKWADNNMKQHKWHKEIKAWADGAEIECQYKADSDKEWQEFDGDWSNDDGRVFRIKPQPVEPQYLYVWTTPTGIALTAYKEDLISEFKYIGKIPLIVESNDD